MKKESNQEHNLLEIKTPENASDIFRQVIEFLQLFLPVTLAKRLATVILLAIGMPVRDAVGLTGLCEKSMWTLKKQILDGLDSGNYRTRQEIADMIGDNANDSYITASEVCGMLRKVKAEYGEKKVHIVLDNARHQKCRIVQELAGQLDIQLEYIPPYSPDLNLIERVSGLEICQRGNIV